MKAKSLIGASQCLSSSCASAIVVTLARIFPKIQPTVVCFYLLLVLLALLALGWKRDPAAAKSEMNWQAGLQRQTVQQQPLHLLSPGDRFKIALLSLSALVGVVLAIL